MKLSRSVGYAIRATMQLAKDQSGTPIPCSQLAREGKMPERFLAHVLSHLVRHGILRSTRGIDGGFTLGKPPDEISLLEVIEAIEGPIEAEKGVPLGMASDEQAKFQEALQQVVANNRRQLEAIRFSQLLALPPEQAAPIDEDEPPEQGKGKGQGKGKKEK